MAMATFLYFPFPPPLHPPPSPHTTFLRMLFINLQLIAIIYEIYHDDTMMMMMMATVKNQIPLPYPVNVDSDGCPLYVFLDLFPIYCLVVKV